MRRLTQSIITSAIISALVVTPSFAAVKSGAKCTTKGETKISGSKTFTCIKSGKKLVWNKGVTEKKAPTSSETSAPKSDDSLSFMSSEPSEQISFSNLAKNYAYVPFVAWKKSADKIAKFQPADVKITVLVGENTDPINKNPSAAVTLASRMYGDYKQASEFVLIYYSIYDIPWAEKLVEEYIGDNGGYDTSDTVRKMCPSRNSCNAAAALSNSVTGIGLTVVTASDQMRNDPVFNSGTLEAHEYSHTIQKKQYFGRMPQGLAPPQWLTEGGAEFIQTASVHNQSFDKYLTDRKRVTEELYKFKNFDSNWLNAFLNPAKLGTEWDLWKSYYGFRVYDVGFMTSEILVAIAGPNSIMEVFKLMGDGLSFQDSFFKIFGVKWDSAIKTITSVLASQIG
jgi:hypothetical protein